MVPKSFGTHDGTFHADEVSACALLLVFGLIERSSIVRSRDPEALAECAYVCDVGGIYDPEKKRFDHHQLEYTGDLSSAGMIWLYLLRQRMIDEPLYAFLNHCVILGIDAHDNGRSVQQDGVATFSHIIASFVPPQYTVSADRQNSAFQEALDFAMSYFQRLIQRFNYIRQCKDQVAAAMKQRGIYLLFDEPIPWQENFFDLGGEEHPALFVIMPSEGHWKLRGIPPDRENKMQVRRPLPKKWAGLRDEELKKASGIAGAIFCHKGRFISVWETKEDALKALKQVMETNE
jgi:uncharacterized UPF0160 family protein